MFGRAGDRSDAPILFDADRPAVEAARGDAQQFEPLYRRYVGQIYSLALYELRDAHAAEDVTEQVFLRALDALPRFEERGDGEASTFRVWLFRIYRSVVRNERRRDRRHPQEPLAAAFELAARDDPAADAVAHEEARLAFDAVDRLPHDRRQALLLRFVEEMSTSEIAATLGRSEGAVRVLIHRALRSVAQELARLGSAAADPPEREPRRDDQEQSTPEHGTAR